MPTRLVDALRQWSDDQLAALLAARPDLAVPVPEDLAALAGRAQSRLSLARALEGLDRFTLEVLDALRLAADGVRRDGLVESTGTADLADVLTLAAPVGPDRVREALATLRGLALVYGPDAELRVATGLDEVTSPYPAGLGRPGSVLDPETAGLVADPALLRRVLLSAPPEARAVLDRLAAGPPVGTVRLNGADTPVGWLVRRHLLVPERSGAAGTVELPRELGLLLRRDTGPLGELHPAPPPLPGTAIGTGAVDAAGAGQVMEAVRLVAAMADALAAESTPVLKSGGVGVRDLRRLARACGVGEDVAALLLEVARAAELIDQTADEQPAWLPTAAYDTWRAAEPSVRWATLARAWLTMPRQPGLTGMRDIKDKPITALSGEAARMTAPVLRRAALSALADLPPGTAVGADELIGLLAWRSPRRAGGAASEALRWCLAEAATLGVTGRGALTGYGRALLSGGEPTASLAELLPAPIGEVLLQADLTVVVPGPPEQTLAAELELIADAESAGHATVYRVTPASVRRALDAGMSAADLHALFARRSATPVPQSLTYLVDDVARRHGGLRVGACASYLRGEDPALLAEVAADRRLALLGLRTLAPTVLISPYQPHRVLDLLRDNGYTPVAEDGGGVVLLARPQPARATSNGYRRPPARDLPERLSDEMIAQVIGNMRHGEETNRLTRRPSAPGPRSTADALAVLNQAIQARQRIWVRYVDAHGGNASRLVRPVSIGAGYLRAADDRTETLHTFALHRITSATPAE